MRRTAIARTHHDVARLRFAWDNLATHHAATMFQSFAWNYIAACAFQERETPFVIYSESDQGTAIIPAAVDRKKPRLTFLGETLFDYRDVLCSGGDELLHSAWNRAAQVGLKFSSGALRADADFKQWSGFDVSRLHGAPRVSPKEITSEQFVGEHNRLGRWLRRLQREGIELRCRTGADTELVRNIYRSKGNQPAPSGDNLFSDSLRVQVMMEVCRAVGSACEIYTLESAGSLIAALVTFRDRQVRRFYTIYFDQAWAKYSPGMVLMYEVVRRSLRDGLECDLMTGEQGYKLRLATSVVPMYWAEASSDALAMLGQPPAALAA